MSERVTLTAPDGHTLDLSFEDADTLTKALLEQVVPIREARHKAWEEEQRAAGNVYHAHYWRYHSEYRDEFFDPLDAARFLADGSDRGDLAVVGVIYPDGSERGLSELLGDDW